MFENFIKVDGKWFTKEPDAEILLKTGKYLTINEHIVDITHIDKEGIGYGVLITADGFKQNKWDTDGMCLSGDEDLDCFVEEYSQPRLPDKVRLKIVEKNNGAVVEVGSNDGDIFVSKKTVLSSLINSQWSDYQKVQDIKNWIENDLGGFCL